MRTLGLQAVDVSAARRTSNLTFLADVEGVLAVISYSIGSREFAATKADAVS